MPNATLELLLARNRTHAARVSHHDAEYFSRHEAGQAPRCLWIGCADSRVPVDTLVQASPGELFVMRNVANQVLAEDDSIMSGIEYALNTLRVDTVIICGHTHCGGVDFAGLMAVVPGEEKKDTPLTRQMFPLSQALRQQIKQHPEWRQLSKDHLKRFFVEANVRQQIVHLQQTSLFQSAKRQRLLEIFGCIYDLKTGILDVLSDENGEVTL
jgi:carbonic anhydrase